MEQIIFIADHISCSSCFRHHYAHHQVIESIIQMVAACVIWCFGFNLLQLVGILFPHINEDAQLKPLQICRGPVTLTPILFIII
jgi:energy-converting hydrogenase Eha subunit F